MFEKTGSYLLGDVTLEIIINTEDGLMDIVLGNINYSSYGRGTPNYEILNAEEVRATMAGILNLN